MEMLQKTKTMGKLSSWVKIEVLFLDTMYSKYGLTACNFELMNGYNAASLDINHNIKNKGRGWILPLLVVEAVITPC